MAINTNLLLLVMGGLMLAHIIASIGESLIAKGALQLDGETMARIWAREALSSTIWKTGESIAMVVLIVGMLKAWGKLGVAGGHWGIPAMIAGFGLFCGCNVLRAWLCRAAFEAEAPGTKAARGALLAGIMTTVVECAVGIVVCGYIYTHIISSTPSSPPRTTNATSTMTSTSTSTSTVPASNRVKDFVSEAEALELLPGKDMKYLQGLVNTKRVRTRNEGGKIEYHRADIVEEKKAGLPEQWELEPDGGEGKPKDPEKTERVEP